MATLDQSSDLSGFGGDSYALPQFGSQDQSSGSGFDVSSNEFAPLTPFYSPGTPATPPTTPATVAAPTTTDLAPKTTTPAATTTDGATTGIPATTSGTGSAAPTSATGSNTGIDWLDTIINAATGGKGFGSAIGGMAPYLADYAIASKMADKTQAQNQKTIQPLYDQATKYLDAASKELGLYESNSINPAQQIELDRNAATQKAQLAQYYSSNGIQDSTMMMQGMQNIDNSTVVMKQGFVDDSLRKALALEGAGITPLMTAVQDKLISDTQLSQSMMELMGNLAKAWAYQTAQQGGGSGGSGGTASGAAGGGVSSLVNKGVDWLKGKVGDWLGGSATPVGADGASVLTSFGAPDLSSLYGLSGIPSDLGGVGAAADAASTFTPTLGIPLTGPAATAETAAYAPSAIEATSPSAAAGVGSTAAGLAMGAGAFAAWYGLSRLLAGTGQMSDADWVKKLTGNYATANDQYKAALQSGNTDAAFRLGTTMGEAAWSASEHYKAMGDQANAAKWLKTYQDLTARGSWYNTQLVNRSGGATSGQHGSKTSKLL